MVFSQLSFLYFFFPLVIVLYFLIRSRPWRNAVLLVCSLLFYSWGEPRYVLVMVAASLAAWLAGLLIEHFRARPGRKKLVLAACVVPPVLCGAAGLAPLAAAAGYCLAVWRGFRQLDGMSGDISGFGLTLGELAGAAVLCFVR